MEIGIYKRTRDDVLAAVIHREGETRGLEGYMYRTKSSFKGDYISSMPSEFNIPVDLSDKRIAIVMKDLKEKAEKLKLEKRKEKVQNLIAFYENEEEDIVEVVEEAIIEKNILYFAGNIIDLNKMSIYDKKNKIMIIDGIKMNMEIPEEIMDMIVKSKKTKQTF